MKRFLVLIQIIGMILTLAACSGVEETVEEAARAVKVKEIQETENSVTLDYIGTIDAKDIVEYSFKTEGKLNSVFVEKGDKVEKGDILAKLDTKDLQLQFNTAKTNYEYNRDLYMKMEKLYSVGAISLDQYEQKKLQKEVSESEYENIKILLEEAVIYADREGSIVDLSGEVGEWVQSYQVIIILRSKDQIINVGIAQKDLKKIDIGTEAIIDVDGDRANGKITSIAEAPDETTRTYNAKVAVEDKSFRLGSIAKVKFNIGNESGIWIPISAIMSDGEDYVYIAQKDRAFKRTIELGRINGDFIMVKGITPGELLIVNGMKSLSDGSKIKVKE